MPKCRCCGTEINKTQEKFSGLCPCCDLGKCQNPKEFHKLQKRVAELEEKVFSVMKGMASMEWGFKAHEKGWNLEKSRQEFNKIIGGKK